jgi:hypothetical protein
MDGLIWQIHNYLLGYSPYGLRKISREQSAPPLAIEGQIASFEIYRIFYYSM